MQALKSSKVAPKAVNIDCGDSIEILGKFLCFFNSHPRELNISLFGLFRTYWDLHCEVLSFVSRIGRTMYFHRRSLPIFKMCRSVSKKSQFVSNKNIRPWKVLEGFLFTHCKASKNPLRFCCSHSLVFFVFFLCIATREMRRVFMG